MLCVLSDSFLAPFDWQAKKLKELLEEAAREQMIRSMLQQGPGTRGEQQAEGGDGTWPELAGKPSNEALQQINPTETSKQNGCGCVVA